MEKVLDKAQTASAFFRPKARFLVSLHGTFTGETFVYCVPKESFIAEADRVDADNWIKMHDDALTSSDPSRELACGEGYICQIRAANAGRWGYGRTVYSTLRSIRGKSCHFKWMAASGRQRR